MSGSVSSIEQFPYLHGQLVLEPPSAIQIRDYNSYCSWQRYPLLQVLSVHSV